MKTFDDLKFTKHPIGVGVQARIQFDNGYGASVVQGYYINGGDKGLYELAVLDNEGHVTYDTPIANDVIGYLTEEEVTNVLKQIQEL